MTASKVSSSVITNRKATPPVYNPLGAAGDCKLRTACGTIEVATTSIDEVGDVILLCPVRGNERVLAVTIYNDDMDTHSTPTLAADVGLYKDVSAAGTAATVVAAAAYASAVTTLQAANTLGVDVAFEARDINKMGQTVAADGAESEHNNERYIGLTITAVSATAAAGTLSWRVTVAEA